MILKNLSPRVTFLTLEEKEKPTWRTDGRTTDRGVWRAQTRRALVVAEVLPETGWLLRSRNRWITLAFQLYCVARAPVLVPRESRNAMHTRLCMIYRRGVAEKLQRWWLAFHRVASDFGRSAGLCSNWKMSL